MLIRKFACNAVAALGLTLITSSVMAAGTDDLNRADALLREGQARRALQLYDQAIASGDLNRRGVIVAYLKRADAYLALGELDNAHASFTRVIELDPRNPLGYHFRGQLYMQRKQFDKAIRDFTRVILLDPSKAEGWYNRAMAHLAKGDLGSPLEDLRRAIEAQPNDPVAYYYRGNLYFYQGNYAAAAADFRRHAELAPDNPYTAIKLYATAARAGENATHELRALAARVKNKTWPYPIIELYLGERTPQSVLDEVAASGAGPRHKERDCEAYFYVGYYFLLAGDTSRAKALFEKALATGVEDFNEYKVAKAELWRL